MSLALEMVSKGPNKPRGTSQTPREQTQHNTVQHRFPPTLSKTAGSSKSRDSKLQNSLKHLEAGLAEPDKEFRNRIEALRLKERGEFPKSSSERGKLNVTDDGTFASLRRCFLDIKWETMRQKMSNAVILEPTPTDRRAKADSRYIMEEMLSSNSKEDGSLHTSNHLQEACRRGKRYTRMVERLGLGVFILLGETVDQALSVTLSSRSLQNSCIIDQVDQKSVVQRS